MRRSLVRLQNYPESWNKSDLPRPFLVSIFNLIVEATDCRWNVSIRQSKVVNKKVLIVRIRQNVVINIAPRIAVINNKVPILRIFQNEVINIAPRTAGITTSGTGGQFCLLFLKVGFAH